MNTSEQIVDLIIKEKDKQNLSLSELARRTGLAKSTLSRYFNKTREFPLNRASDFAKSLNVPTEYLLGIEGKPLEELKNYIDSFRIYKIAYPYKFSNDDQELDSELNNVLNNFIHNRDTLSLDEAKKKVDDIFEGRMSDNKYNPQTDYDLINSILYLLDENKIKVAKMYKVSDETDALLNKNLSESIYYKFADDMKALENKYSRLHSALDDNKKLIDNIDDSK